jgi:nucleoside-triphosphatase
LDKRVLLLTGPPGVGKTTVLAKTVVALNSKGYNIGGMISREIRQGRIRIGFEILDLTTSKRGWLAHVDQKYGPQVGKYHVNLADLKKVGAQAIIEAVETCDVIAIDEIGPMELLSERFREAARKSLDSRKLVIAVVHWKTQDELTGAAKNRQDAETINVTPENREKLSEIIVEKAIAFLRTAD